MHDRNKCDHVAVAFAYSCLSFRAVFGEFYTELIENHVLFKTPEEEAKAAQASREA